jgi:hypothetical protein
MTRMRGDVVFRVYGVHAGRDHDNFFGAFRTRAEAEREIAKLEAKEMHGRNWAAQYHDQGFVIREHVVETDFEMPPRPKPRDAFFVEFARSPNAPGHWDSTRVEVFRRGAGAAAADHERVCGYVRDHAMFETFEPFRQGTRELALISRAYTRTAVLDLRSGEVIAEETESTPGGGFCPVGFYVPDWWDVHDASIIPGSEYWDADNEWPVGDFGFVWGCHWGDDTSWKVQHLDLRRVQEGILMRDDRFGYVELATGRYTSPCLSPTADPATPSRPPGFISVRRHAGVTRVRFDVELDFDLDSGRVDESQHAALKRSD